MSHRVSVLQGHLGPHSTTKTRGATTATKTNDLLESISANGVATLTLNRPHVKNALSVPMMFALTEALERLDNDPDVRCIVLTGSGKGFCAGGDVKSMASGGGDGATLSKGPRTFEGYMYGLRSRMEASRMLHEIRKPTIASIRGAAAGAGLSLAMACDIRICSEKTKLTTAFGNVGFSGDFGGSYFLTQLVGTAKARELYYTSAILNGKEAFDIGLVNRLVPDNELEAETEKLASKIASGPPIAITYMKRNMNAAERLPLKDCLDLEALHHSRTSFTDDHKNATKAFVAKRKPVFHGR